MTLSALGIFSAAGAGGGATGTYELIESNILTGNQTSITFSSLGTYSSNYKHLQLRVTGRSTTTFGNENDSFYIRLNGDSGSNYSFHQLSGNGSSVSSAGSTSQTYAALLMMASNGAGANIFGAGVVDILDSYSTSKNKTMRSFTGVYVNTQRFAMVRSSAWLNTASITSITVGSIDGSMVAGSRLSLYGVK
jgi:hypothetical protein